MVWTPIKWDAVGGCGVGVWGCGGGGVDPEEGEDGEGKGEEEEGERTVISNVIALRRGVLRVFYICIYWAKWDICRIYTVLEI